MKKNIQPEQPKMTEIQSAIEKNPQVKRGEGSLGKLTREEMLANLGDLRASASRTQTTGDESTPQRRVSSGIMGTPLSTQQDVKEGFDYLQDEPPEPTGDPQEDRLNRLTWERNQALKQAQAVTEASQVARQTTEDIAEDRLADSIQQRGQELDERDVLGRRIRRDALGNQIGGVGAEGGMIRQGSMINPAYQDLTDEEKRMNMFDIDPQTGRPIRRDRPRVAPTVDFNKTIQNAKLYSSPKSDVYRNRSNAEILKMINQEDVENLQDDMKNLKIDLGLERGQSLTVNDAGEFEIIDEKGEIFDPVKRAEDRYERETGEQVQEAKEQHEKNLNYIRSRYSKADGTLTLQGKRKLLEAQKDYNRTISRYERDRGEQLESIIAQEKKRQQAVEGVLTPRSYTMEERIAQAERNEYIGLINNFINESRDEAGRPTIGILEASRMVKNVENRAGIKGVKNLREFQGYLSSQAGQNSSPVQMFETAIAISGSANDAEDMISDALSGDVAKMARDEWVASTWDYDKEDIELKTLELDAEKLYNTPNADPSGLKTSSMLKRMKSADPTGFLQEEFLRNIKNSPNSSFKQLTIAEMGLAQVEREQKTSGTKYSIIKDRFGETVAVNPYDITDIRRVDVEMIGESLLSNPITTSMNMINYDVKMADARDYASGLKTASDINASYSPREAEEVLRLGSSIRSKQQAEGQKLSDKQIREINEKIQDTNAFKSLDTVDMTLAAFENFEKAFNKVGGIEPFGQTLESPYRTAQLQLKEFFNLGVLNGADLDVLEGIIPNPTGGMVSGFLTGGIAPALKTQKVRNGIETVRKMMAVQIQDHLRAIDTIYGDLGDVPAVEKVRKQGEEALRRLGINPQQEIVQEINNQEQPQIGSITQKFEGTPSTISHDMDINGNTFNSYGSFQMNRGIAQSFAKAMGFKNTDPSTEEFKAEWISKSQNPDFQENERRFITQVMFEPSKNKIKQVTNIPDRILNDRRIQELIFDLSVNAGTNNTIFIDALRGKNPRSIEDIIIMVEDERKRRIQGHPMQGGLESRIKGVSNKLINNA